MGWSPLCRGWMSFAWVEAPWPGGSDRVSVSVVLGLDIRVLEKGFVCSVCLSVHRLGSSFSQFVRCCVRTASAWRDRLRERSTCPGLGGRRAPRGFMFLFCSGVICEFVRSRLAGTRSVLSWLRVQQTQVGLPGAPAIPVHITSPLAVGSILVMYSESGHVTSVRCRS